MSIETIKRETARHLNICAKEITESNPGRSNVARLIAMHLADKMSALSNTEIAVHFGVKQPPLPVMLCRFRTKIADRYEIAKQIDGIEGLVRAKHVLEPRTC